MAHGNAHAQGTPLRGELFLVATPIGNLGDITLRALETLKSVDRIACEDTRTSFTLLKHYGIKAPLVAYHHHNEATATEHLIADLQNGQKIALVSDAGTPLLSDPGARLVSACIEAGIRVTPLPGASALLAAVTIAGLPASQFFYAGFLPVKTGARKQALEKLATMPATMVFYEAPHRLLETLEAIQETYGQRSVAVARELTKLHEECVRGSLAEVLAHFTATAPRGECVIVLEGAPDETPMDDEAVDEALRHAMQTERTKDAAALVAKRANRSKSDVYARALVLKNEA